MQRVPEPADQALWVKALASVVLLQVGATILTRVVPTLGPAMAGDLGWTESTIGYLSAVTTIGSIAFLLGGSPLILHTGPIRGLQIGLLLGILGLIVLGLPVLAFAVVASFLIGLGYGPTAPAGSELLQRYSPARHRNLIFSIKQAGVPLAGVATAIVLPPIAEAFGWPAAMLASALAVVIAVVAVQPVRAPIDGPAERLRSFDFGSLLSPRNFLSAVDTVTRSAEARRLSMVGMLMGIGHGCWTAYLVTFAVYGLNYSLTAAGLFFAVMQAAGIAGRMIFGWTSDRIGSGLPVLWFCAFASAGASLAAALAGPDWPVWAVGLLAFIGGAAASGWNGVQMAEIADRAAPGQLAQSTAAGAAAILLGYAGGPTIFGMVLAASDRFDLGFYFVVSATLLTPLSLIGLRPTANR